jgi:hypothetical protein
MGARIVSGSIFVQGRGLAAGFLAESLGAAAPTAQVALAATEGIFPADLAKLPDSAHALSLISFSFFP